MGLFVDRKFVLLKPVRVQLALRLVATAAAAVNLCHRVA